MDWKRQLITAFKKGRVAFLVGAGASVNSGIPTVNGIYDEILKVLNFTKEEYDDFYGNVFPFETFMACIKDIIPEYFSLFLDIFKAKEFNSNHYFMANCIKNGFAQDIFTTNFDNLIEKALERYGIKFKIHYTQKHLDKLYLGKNNVIHLHGYIQSKRTIVTTINKVAGLKGIEARRKAIVHLLNSHEYDVVLSLGYSYSDLFDINPNIEYNSNKTVSFIMLDYLQNKTEVILAKDSQKVFSNYPNSYIIRTNVDSFIQELNIELFGHKVPDNTYTTRWKEYIGLFFNELDTADKLAIKGNIFTLLHKPKKTLEYYNEAIKSCSYNKRDFYTSLYINQLNELGHFELVKSLVKEQYDDFKKSKFPNDKLKGANEIEIRVRLVTALVNLNETEDIFQHLDKCKSLIERYKLYNYIPEVYFYYIDVLISEGKFSSCEKFIKQAIKKCAIYTPQNLSVLYGKYADIKMTRGDSEEALNIAMKSWDLANKHSNLPDINSSLCRLNGFFMSFGDLEKSKLCLDELIKITPLLKNLLDKAFNFLTIGEGFSAILENFSNVDKLAIFKKSETSLQNALQIFSSYNMKIEEILTLVELCRLNAIIKKEEQVFAFEKAIKNKLKFINDKHSTFEVFDGVSYAFQILGNKNKSLEWLSKLSEAIKDLPEYEQYFEILNIENRLLSLK